jgi:hypothetical protein
MDFFAGQGARRAWLLPIYRLYNHGLPLAGGRHRSVYGNDEQRRHAEKDAVLCFDISDPQH